MSDHKGMKWAHWLTRVAFGAGLLLYLLLVVMVIHWHINPEAYQTWYLVNGFDAGLSNFKVKLKPPGSEGLALSDLSAKSMYWWFFRSSLLFFMSLLILWKWMGIIRSIRSLKTFYDQNIRSFQSMAALGLWMALIGSFNINFEQSNMVNLSIPFGALLFSAGCLVLKMVFSEGKKLFEDSKAII